MDAGEKFIDHIISEVGELREILKRKTPMKELTTNQKQAYHLAAKCYICTKNFNSFDNDINQRKVRDHCHLTGNYRGAAHSFCSLNLAIDP